MPTSAITDVIRYYCDCFQASFFSAVGYGLFDHPDVEALAVLPGSGPLNWSEQWQQQFVFDADQMNLMLIDGITLIPEPNPGATTDAHYRPTRVALMNRWAEHPDAAPDWGDEWQTQLQADCNPADTVAPEISPALSDLNLWLQKQARNCQARTRLPIRILALIPKSFRASAHKGEFVAHLQDIVTRYHGPSSLLWPFLLLQKATPADAVPASAPASDLPFLSEHQNRAMSSGMTERFSLVQGPPGTGKSRLLATLAAQLAGDGQSVLLTSHSDHALTVLREKLVSEIGIDPNWLVHLGPGRRTRRLAQQLSRLMTGSGPDDASGAVNMTAIWRQYHRQRNRLSTLLHRQSRLGLAQITGDNPGWQRLLQLWWSVRHRDPHQINRQIGHFHSAVDTLRSSYCADINYRLSTHFFRSRQADSSAWAALIQGLRRDGLRQVVSQLNQTRSDLFTPASGLKLWLIKLDDLPEQAFGHFDTVIIDEATQVNMAEAIAALAMSQRAVIAGDPGQLRHYSFLSHRQEARIAQNLGLSPDVVVSYRDTSLLDYTERYLTGVGAFRASHLLNEHYRSIPPLLDFSSQNFYQGDVRALTGQPQVNSLKLQLDWQQVDGQRVDKINREEARAIVTALRRIMAHERNRPTAEKSSLGVLSFFRDQVEYLKQLILKECSLNDIRAHRVKVGTPFSFQGEERDHMLVSCAIDNNSHTGTWGYLNQPDVFNVATSRARRRQTLFLSCPPEQLPPGSILRACYDFSQAPATPPESASNSAAWLKAITEPLQQAGFRTQIHQYIADIPIDLILEADDTTLAVDLIGFPPEVSAAVHLQRYQALFRTGIPVFPLSAKEWRHNRQVLLLDLQNRADTRYGHSTRRHNNPAPRKPATFLSIELWQRLSLCQQSPELQNEFDPQLLQLSGDLEEIAALLGTLFRPGSLTYLRYQSAVIAVVEQTVENLETFRLLFSQVWERGSQDHAYWEHLIAPIQQRHNDYQNALNRLLTSLRQTLASPGTDDFRLNDLEELTERLTHYR